MREDFMSLTNSAQNTEISPNFLARKLCENAQLPQKLCVCTKSPHQEISWNYCKFLKFCWKFFFKSIPANVKQQTITWPFTKTVNKVMTLTLVFRSSCQEMFDKKVYVCNFIKKARHRRCFPKNSTKFFRATIL